MKKTFYTEWAYLAGIAILAAGTAFMERADFGVSMVVAPAYLLYLKISTYLPFFTFGMAEYTLQAVIIAAMMIVLRKFKLSYLFSFVTAVIYGLLLDASMLLAAMLPDTTFAYRMVYYIVGMLCCSLGVSLLFHTYISPEAYELFVKEMSAKLHMDINRLKTLYDCASCAVAIVLSFSFFGLWHFEGVKLGTIVCALINGTLIGRITKLLESVFDFKDGLSWHKYFEA